MARQRGLVGAALLAVAVFSALSMATAQTLPGDPPGTYRAAYGYVLCEPDATVSPLTTADVALAVTKALADARKAGKALRVRASRNKFHTTTTLACPDQTKPHPGANGTTVESLKAHHATDGFYALAVLHDGMDKVISYDPVKFTMTVGAGMRVKQLLEEATRLNMSVMAGALPAYAGLTVAGIIAAGAHGTGDMTVSTPADMILEVTWVDGRGAIQKARPGSPEFNALSSGIGLTGVITEVTFQMTPPTNTKLITRYLSSDADMFGDIEKMLKHAPHMLVFWRPDFKMYSAYMMKPTEASVPATDDYMTLLPSFAGRGNMTGMYQGFQNDIFDAGMPMASEGERFMCPTVAYHSVAKTWANARDGTPVLYSIAPTNNMVASECDDNCAWNGPQYNGTAEDVHFAIEWDQFKEWIADIKSILQKDVWGDPKLDAGRCLGPGYIWLRFGHPREEYLHMAYGMKRPVYVQSTWLRSRGAKAPMRFGWVIDLLEELTLCKYGGRPHWGKNWLRTFTHPKCPLRARYPAFDAQLEMQSKYDPDKIYEPTMWAKVRDGVGAPYYPGCAVTKDCFCQEDAHCSGGMRCAPSEAFPDYKICKPDWDLFNAKVKELQGLVGWLKRLRLAGHHALLTDSAEIIAQTQLVGARS